MRILHVITSLRTGGAEKLMVDLLPRLVGEGHDVHLCVFDGIQTPFLTDIVQKGIPIHALASGGSVYNPRNLWRLHRLMAQGWDVVHTHNTAPQIFAAICSPFHRCVLVTTEHNTTNRRRSWRGYRIIDRWMYSRYRKIVCISDQARTNLLAYLGKDFENRTITIFNGIDFDRYSSAMPADDISRLAPRVITCVSAFRQQKDQPTLIRALTMLPPQYHLCLVGEGPEKSSCERLAAELGIDRRVTFAGVRYDIPQVLAASHFIVMCSHYEGLSLASLEGMAAGKPFLADDVDGLREVAQGYAAVFPHQDSKALAESIMILDDNDGLRNDIAQRCRKHARDFDISASARNYLALYQNIHSCPL